MAFLYKYELNGEIIYVGKTKRNLKKRIYEHKYSHDLPDNCDIYYCRCSEADMNILEVLLINKYKPKYNKDCNTDEYADYPFEEPLWISFDIYSDIHFVGYSKENGKILALYERDDGIIKKKPQYCECDIDMPYKEEHDSYSVCKCSFCGNLIRNSYKESNC